jgi:hypothetical protein
VAEAPLKRPDLATALEDLVGAIEDTEMLALVGGLAVSTRTEPRFTRDLDFSVACDNDAAAERVVAGLVRDGFQLVTALENTKHGRLATVRLRRRSAAPLVDLLFASSGIEAEIVAAAEAMTVLGHSVRVAMVGHLIALKLLARDDKLRPQDRVDLRALAAVATAREWRRAATAVGLIESRGFARRRKLVVALERLRGVQSGHR